MAFFRSRRSRLFISLALSGLILIFSAVAAWILLVNPLSEVKNYTEQTMAEVKEVRVSPDPKTGALLYYPVYEFVVDGVKLMLPSLAGYTFNPYQIGESVSLSFNPADPARFILTSEKVLPWDRLAAGLASIAAGLIGALAFIWYMCRGARLLLSERETSRAVVDLSDLDKAPSSRTEIFPLEEDDQGEKTEGKEKKRFIPAESNEKLRRDLAYQDEYVSEAVAATVRLFCNNDEWCEGFMTKSGRSSLFVPFKQGIANDTVYTRVAFDGGRTLYVDVFPRTDDTPGISVTGFGLYQLRYTKLVRQVLEDLDRGESVFMSDDYAISVDLSS